ncbi:hypothetical protein F558DRAFT_01344 [Streptomyces sp. AmelKG-A3]|nr:hypothetical protein [Streptomyces sp. SID4941]SCD29176.1 hypothetical protein GA0115247_101013 [Streptomyces sp. PalvLS-984]SDC20146.1 hypothetical protein F558DRAFT_01344 [Streptomyces sp. AmelKG-A3]
MSGVTGVRSLRELAGPAGDDDRAAPAGPAGDDGRAVLRHSDGPWVRAADGAEALRTHLGPVPAELAAAHKGLTAGSGALSALAELGTVRASWERRFAAAQGECASLTGKFRAVARTLGGTDETVRSSFTSVAARAEAR